MSAELALRGVGKRFTDAGLPALHDVSLTVEAGSCTAVLGPSGSGKSTLLRVIAGLETADAGSVLIGGRDVAGVAAERRGVGMVFQRSLLFPHLSVVDNVAFAGRVAGASRASARERADAYLEMVQLSGFGDRRVDELSGGQEQRVAIARALAAAPAVLLLDEPFSALDPALRADMHDLLESVRAAASPTIVLVTHDRDEASRVSDRIALIEHGRLLGEGTVAEAYRRPRTMRAAQLMGGRNEVPGTVDGGWHHSALGMVRVSSGVAHGPGTLVIRQEDVVLQPASERHPGVEGVAGVVETLRATGARLEVAVRCRGVLLHAEVSPMQSCVVGQPVVLTLPEAAVHVVTA